MRTITENFETVLREKQISLSKRTLKNGQLLYNGVFQLQKSRGIPFGVVLDKAEGISDYQIVYHKLGYVTDFKQKAEVLELLNELNEMKTGYYRACLGGDGEIYLRLLAKTSNDIQPLYQMMVAGGAIARGLMPELEKIEGINTSNPSK